MKTEKQKWDYKGLLGTVLFHLVLLIAFILMGLSVPLPLPEERGIVINFGTSNDGSGDVQPENPTDPSIKPNNTNEPSSEKSTESSNNPKILTENTTENPPVVSANNETKTTDDKKKEEQKVNDLAIYKGKKNGGTPTGSEGETGKPGDQGDINGDKNSKNHYGTPGSDKGSKGTSFKLTGRSSKFLPKPDYNINEEGTVVVDIWVDQKGKVTKAVPGAKGTTTTSSYLHNRAKEAALKAVFDEKSDAQEIQKGTISYHFILN